MGFHPKWIEWINGCTQNPKFLVFINGKPRGHIQASRGIRQGDPLSPFLFLIISKVLNNLVHKAHDNGLYEGFLVGKDKMHLLILQFADDTLLFCKNDDAMLDILIQTISFFE